MSVDPLADDYASWSPYNYTLNNPLRYTDPTGMGPEPPPYGWGYFKQRITNAFNGLFGTNIPTNGNVKSRPPQYYDVSINGSIKLDVGPQAGVKGKIYGTIQGDAMLDAGSIKLLELGFNGLEPIGDIGGDGNTSEYELGFELGISEKITNSGVFVGAKRQYSEDSNGIIENSDKNEFSARALLFGKGLKYKEERGFSQSELRAKKFGLSTSAAAIIGIEAELEIELKPVSNVNNQD